MAPMSSSAATTSVQVAVRIRPTTSQDTVSIPARFQRQVVHGTSATTVAVDAANATPAGSGSATAVASPTTSATKKQVFTFDQVHPPTVTQHGLFTSTAQPLISRFVEGFNCTILAYGQTSSGKTFTMTGIDLDANPSDPNNGMGIIPRAVSTIFSQARKHKEERGGSWNYSIKGSFIEVYNEDLIDLLSTDEATGTRREVQIREGKDGSIIWGGLREVTVRNSNEVMNLIRQGTSIRRTNETDMNAQSSRSHAIFSLTLTQKKFTGSSPPPRSPSPLPPGSRSPSRLARPGSMYTNGGAGGGSVRMSSPTFGRPATPSFTAAMGRGGLRPASSLGLRPPDNRPDDDDTGEWTTIVSKFHFVDLAGSERLKRTAAAGDRIKEGISINSGLLALGNVISALGDPSRAKSHTATHVPYRDSKLTRLLQDSLGGNAHTLMIACVSPTEWNVGETVNTLKYANRARNIKNRAVLNEKEDGWDDVEWLQGTVTRLRKEMKQLKDGGHIPTSGSESTATATSTEPSESVSKKVLAQMTDLQNNYEDLREKYVDRTEELARLRRELGERHRTSSTGGSVGGTAKYEEIVGPVIEEYEKTISAMEAELGLNRAALRLTNEMVEEKEEELAQINERHSATELYVEELRSRLTKLSEREASTEAYVRDLEEKIKAIDETSMSSSESMTDLRREVARYKESESHSNKYITDLEARLSRSDESVLTLQQTVEKLEADAERRREEAETLQIRLENLQRDGESWRTDLEERERKVRELEQKMEEWERKKKEAGEDRLRLGGIVGEVDLAKRSLESLNGTNGASAHTSGVSTPITADLSIENQLVALQQTHAATLADLSSVTSKYRDALREISDLAAQIQEVKLSNPTIPESPTEQKLDIPPFRRRMTGPKARDVSDPAYESHGRRLFFRQAASAESLHARSLSQSLSQSLSLSQELSSARSRKTSISSHGTSSSVSHSPSHRPNLSISIASLNGASTPTEQRSAVSMEKEIMRLQEVLKDREAEISALEISLKERDEATTSSNLTPVLAINGKQTNGHETHTMHLSPSTVQKFNAVRKSMELHHGMVSQPQGDVPDTDVDESLDRLNELMLSMAQKESQHKELVDSLNDQLSQVRRAHDELTTLSRDQTLNMSTELEGLRSKHGEDLARLEEVRAREGALVESLKQAEASHTATIETLRSEHEEALRNKGIEVDELVSRLKGEHETSLSTLRDQLTEASATLEKAHAEHKQAFGQLQSGHEEALQRHVREAKETLEQTIKEHQVTLAKITAEHEEGLKQKDEAASADLSRTEEEYYNALVKLRTDHAEALQKQAAESTAILERLREDHASELRMAEKARECSLSESQSARDSTLRELQDEHSAAIARKENAFAEDVDKLKTEHARVLSSKEEDYRTRREQLKLDHATAMAVLREQTETQVEQLTVALKRSEDEAQASSSQAREDHEAALQSLREQQASVLEEVTRGHEEEVAQLKAAHEKALSETSSEVEQVRTSILASHAQDVAELESEHKSSLAEVQAALVTAQEQHRTTLEELQATSDRHIAEERGRLEAIIAEMEQKHSTELDDLRSNHSRLLQELEASKSSAEDARSKHEQLLAEEQQRSASSVAELEETHSAAQESARKEHEALLVELESHRTAADEFVKAQAAHVKSLDEKTEIINGMEKDVLNVRAEKGDLEAEVAKLRAELEQTRSEQSKLVLEASKRESLVDELEKHRSVLAEMQENLQRVKDEKDILQAEKSKHELALRDLQVQIARPSGQENSTPRATPDRNVSFTRMNGMAASKLPPPTPPPSIPPPPAPKAHTTNAESQFSISTQSSMIISPSSSKDSTMESPATSIASINTPATAVDSKAVAAKLEDQAKHINEQEVMIKTLNKQLSHCESDLATHMDLVSTLETSLGDSEKNLRKARMQATELARERDSLSAQIEGLRNELQEARREVVTVRKSIVEEKQSLESRLDEERRAKERARAQLDSRMDELQKRKSKFACL